MPRLTARAAASELFVVDGGFVLRARGTGRLWAALPAGLYKLRAVAGRSEWTRVVALRGDLTVELPPVAFGSADPLADARGAAATALPPPEADAGRSTTFVFVARWWTGSATTADDPSRGARLVAPDSRVRFDFDRTPNGGMARTGDAGPVRVTHAAGDRHAGVALTAAPGLYALHLVDGGEVFERTVTLLPGWRVQVSVLYEPVPGATPGARRTDATRQALADERSTVPPDLLDTGEAGSEAPMLWLYGAHLMRLLATKGATAARIGRRAASTRAPSRPSWPRRRASSAPPIPTSSPSAVGPTHCRSRRRRCSGPAGARSWRRRRTSRTWSRPHSGTGRRCGHRRAPSSPGVAKDPVDAAFRSGVDLTRAVLDAADDHPAADPLRSAARRTRSAPPSSTSVSPNSTHHGP